VSDCDAIDPPPSRRFPPFLLRSSAQFFYSNSTLPAADHTGVYSAPFANAARSAVRLGRFRAPSHGRSSTCCNTLFLTVTERLVNVSFLLYKLYCLYYVPSLLCTSHHSRVVGTVTDMKSVSWEGRQVGAQVRILPGVQLFFALNGEVLISRPVRR